jgi:hypothetical protein
MSSNTTVILVGVLFYHGYMFRHLIGPSSGYSGGLHCYYQSIYIITITITLWQEISYFTYTHLVCLCSWAVDSIWLSCFMLSIGWGLAVFPIWWCLILRVVLHSWNVLCVGTFLGPVSLLCFGFPLVLVWCIFSLFQFHVHEEAARNKYNSCVWRHIWYTRID